MVVGALVRSMHRIDLRNAQWIEHIAVVFVVEQIVRQPILRILTRVNNSAELRMVVLIAIFLFISLFDIDWVGDVLRCLAVWSYRRLLAILSDNIGRTSHICLWRSFEWAYLRRLRLHYLTVSRLINYYSWWVRGWSISSKELSKISDRRLLWRNYTTSLLLKCDTSCLLLLFIIHGRLFAEILEGEAADWCLLVSSWVARGYRTSTIHTDFNHFCKATIGFISTKLGRMRVLFTVTFLTKVLIIEVIFAEALEALLAMGLAH